jgi:2'-5' RNA ligase
MISHRKIISSFLKISRDFSCITCPFPWDIANEIRDWEQKNIPVEDLINDGYEKDIHVTVKYGLHNHDPYEIRPIIRNFKPIHIILGEISIFENEGQDVVKISVDSPDLVKLNKIICESFDHTNTYSEYVPHCTLAYVKSGLGKKYKDRPDFLSKEIILKEILFSGNDYRETSFYLKDVSDKIPTN